MLEKKYDHLSVEKDKYENWKEKGYFESGDLSKKPYAIVIPPPNVTGKLHLGHAWDTTLQDIMIRYKKLDGFDTLWLPGMDHAAIATEAKVVARLKDNGINKYELGREGFLKVAWKWKEEYSEKLENLKKEILDYVNEKVSKFSKVSEIDVQKEEFEKTATKKIKRFLYTKDEDSDINRKS
jgi:valyl-tRNA synthetase